MPRKVGLMGSLSSLALAAGLVLSPADQAFAATCDELATSNDAALLNATYNDASVPAEIRQCAFDRLIQLAPAAGGQQVAQGTDSGSTGLGPQGSGDFDDPS